MLAIVQSARYLNDVRSLAEYGQSHFGLKLTREFLGEIKALEQTIAAFPMLGESFDNDVRRILIQSYWLYYRVDGSQVVFLRIFRTESSEKGPQGS